MQLKRYLFWDMVGGGDTRNELDDHVRDGLSLDLRDAVDALVCGGVGSGV